MKKLLSSVINLIVSRLRPRRLRGAHLERLTHPSKYCREASLALRPCESWPFFWSTCLSLHRPFFRSSDPGRPMVRVALLISSAPFVSRGGWEVVLHVSEGQNHLFASHFLQLHCEEDGAGDAWRRANHRRVQGSLVIAGVLA
jgi:hypothetical protein